MIKIKDKNLNIEYKFTKTLVDEFVYDLVILDFEIFSTKYPLMTRYILYAFIKK